MGETLRLKRGLAPKSTAASTTVSAASRQPTTPPAPERLERIMVRPVARTMPMMHGVSPPRAAWVTGCAHTALRAAKTRRMMTKDGSTTAKVARIAPRMPPWLLPT